MALVNTLAIRLEAITSGFTAGFEKATGAVGRIAGGLDNFGKKTEEANRRATEAAKNITNLGGAASGIGDAFQAIAAASSVAGQGVGQFGAVTDDILEKTRALEDSIREFAGSLEQELADLAGEAAPAAQGIFKLGEEAAALGPKGIPVIDKIIAKLEELNRIPGKSAGAFNVTIDNLKRLRTEAEAVGKPVGLLTQFTNAFVGTLKKGQTPLSAFIEKNKTLGNVFSNLRTFVAGLNPVMAALFAVTGLAAGALAAAVSIGAKYADSINAVAQRTGFATDALSRLKFIAEQSNTSFEDLSSGLKVLNQNLGEAQAGNKTAAKAFADLKVAIEDGNGALRSSDAVFDDVRSALSGIDNDAKRAALSTAVFGRSAFQILPFLRLTTEEVEALSKRAENLGLVVSEEFARQADVFGDNIDTLKGAALGFNNFIAERLLPSINAFLELIIDGAERFIPKFKDAMDALALSIRPLGEGLFPVLKIVLEQVGLLFNDLVDAVLEVAFVFDRLVVSIKLTVAEIAQLEAKARGNKAGVAELGLEIERLNKRLRQSPQEFKALASAFADVQGESSSTAAAVKKLGEEEDKTTTETVEVLTALQTLTKSLEPIRDELEGGVSAAKSFAESLLEIGSPKAIAQYNALIAQLIKTGQAGDDAAMRVARALIGAEGPEFPPEERARREAEFRAAGPQIPADTRAFREEELRRQQFDVGPEVPEHLETVRTIFGDIITLTEETKTGLAVLETFAQGFGGALASVFSASNKKAFLDFFKSIRDQIIAVIAKVIVLKTLLGIFPGLPGFLGKLGSLFGFDDPRNDAFAQNEGARFGLLFGRGLRSTLGQTAFAGIGANLGTANVVIEPQIVVQNAGPLARVEWFDRGQEQRLRRRQEELGGAPL